jgi:hypothetical protein
VEQDKWDDSILRDIPSEVSLDEKRKLDKMGKITIDEQIDFHFALENPDVLPRTAPERDKEPRK